MLTNEFVAQKKGQPSVTVAIIAGVSEVFKNLVLKVELIPLLNVVNSILINLVLNGFNVESALYGLIMGLIACGLLDQSKIKKLF